MDSKTLASWVAEVWVDMTNFLYIDSFARCSWLEEETLADVETKSGNKDERNFTSKGDKEDASSPQIKRHMKSRESEESGKAERCCSASCGRQPCVAGARNQ